MTALSPCLLRREGAERRHGLVGQAVVGGKS